MDVFTAAHWADKVPTPQFKVATAVFAAASQRRSLNGQFGTFSFCAFGKKLKAGLKRLWFHASNKAHFANQLLNSRNALIRMRGIVLVNRFQGYVKQPLNQACLMHGNAACRSRLFSCVPPLAAQHTGTGTFSLA